jgi:hypothetical protein
MVLMEVFSDFFLVPLLRSFLPGADDNAINGFAPMGLL